MNKSTKVKIIDLLPVIFTILFGIVACVFAVLLYENKWYFAILLCLAGIILNYVAGVLIHEAGHVIAAKKCRMKAMYLNLGIVTIDYVAQKVTPFTFFKKDAGEARFMTETDITEKQIKRVAAGGLTASLIFMVIGTAAGVIISLLTENATAFCLFTAGQAANFYIFAVNGLSSDKTSDGNIAFGNSDYPAVLAACSNIERAVLSGDIPSEPDVIKSNNQPIALYFHYLFTAISSGKDSALDLLDENMNLDELSDQEYALLLPELIFKLCERNSLDEKYKSLAEDFFAAEPDGVSVLRAHYTYREYIGDEKWSSLLKGSYNKLLENEKPFIVAAENALTK